MNTQNIDEKPDLSIDYRGKMFEIITWEGKPGKRFEAAVRAPGVRLLIETEKDNEKALLMTREIRREAGGYDFRLPGGKVFNTLDELDKHRSSGSDMLPIALLSAQKEGREEAGISGGNFELLEIQTAGSSVEWDLYYYVVTDAMMGDQELEESEMGDIETITLTSSEIFEKLKNRAVKEGRSADVLWSWLARNNFITFIT